MPDEFLGLPIHRGLVFYNLLPDTPEELLEEIFDYFNGVGYWAGPDRGELGVPCFWWDPTTKLCKHYDWRPDTCAYHEPTLECCVNSERRCIRCGECCVMLGSPPCFCNEDVETGG